MAETADSTVIATELVSKPQKIAAPRYRFMKVYPTTGSGNIEIKADGRPNVQFEIPTQAFNYSQSYLCGKLLTGKTQGGTDNIVANYVQWLYKDCASFIDRVNFKTRNGATMIDMEHVGNYTKIVNRYETPLEDVMTADSTGVLYSERSLAVAKLPNGNDISHLGIEAAYVEAGLESKDTDAKTDDGKLAWNFRIPLSKIVPNSVFSRRSDLKLPEIAILSLRFAPGTKFSFESTSVLDPSNGAVECKSAATVSGLYLHLARQDDPVYEAMIDERMRAGFVIPLNYPLHSQWTSPSPGLPQQNVAVTYNSGDGHRLVKIYHAVFNNDEKKNTAFDNINDYEAKDGGGALVKKKKIYSYHVKIGGLRTSDEDLSTDDADPSAYLYHQPLLDGTSITNKTVYHTNFAHVEDVARIGGPKRWRELSFRKDDALVGVPLTQDFKFEFVAKCEPVPLQHYTFAVVQRDLKINAVTVHVE